MNIAIIAFGLFAINVVCGLKALNLTGNATAMAGGIKLGNRPNAVFTRQQAFPVGSNRITDGGHCPQTRYDDPFT